MCIYVYIYTHVWYYIIYIIGVFIFIYIYVFVYLYIYIYTCINLQHILCDNPQKDRKVFARCCSWLIYFMFIYRWPIFCSACLFGIAKCVPQPFLFLQWPQLWVNLHGWSVAGATAISSESSLLYPPFYPIISLCKCWLDYHLPIESPSFPFGRQGFNGMTAALMANKSIMDSPQWYRVFSDVFSWLTIWGGSMAMGVPLNLSSTSRLGISLK